MKKLILLLVIAFCINSNAQIITTVVGTGYGAGTGMGNYSGGGGQATAVEMNYTWGLTFDTKGNLQ